jgi:REP element-mobilizing transposase RayT
MDDTRNVGVRFIEPTGKLPKRKEIRLKNYDYKSDGYYFVTICTHKGKPNIRKYKSEVEQILLSLLERFPGLKIDFYVLMSTHLHVIFVFDGMKEGLPEVVRTFNALVTRDTGVKFWQRNYYENVIRNEATLFKIREYIENNPLAEKIRFEELYKSGSDKSVPYKNSPPSS